MNLVSLRTESPALRFESVDEVRISCPIASVARMRLFDQSGPGGLNLLGVKSEVAENGRRQIGIADISIDRLAEAIPDVGKPVSGGCKDPDGDTDGIHILRSPMSGRARYAQALAVIGCIYNQRFCQTRPVFEGLQNFVYLSVLV